MRTKPDRDAVELPALPVVDLTRLDAAAALTLQRQFESVRQQTRSSEAWGYLGGLLWIYGYDAEATLGLETARALDPEDPRWPYFLCRLWTAEKPEAALAMAQRSARLAGTSNLTPRMRAARMLAEQGRWAEAEPELEFILRTDPSFAPASLLLAHAHAQNGKITSALALAQSCGEDPRTAKGAWALMSTLHRRLGDLTQAAEAARRAASLPDDPDLVDSYASEISKLRGDPRDQINVAHDLLGKSQIQAAADAVEDLKRQHPEHPETWLLIGRLQLMTNNLAEAEVSLRNHLRLQPDSTQGLFQLGLSLLGQRQFVQAAEIFDRATRIKPDFGPAYYNRAFALNNAGRFAEALPAFEESLKHNPEHLDSYFFLVDLNLRAGQKETARAKLEAVKSLAPKDRRVAYWEARLAEAP